MTSAPERPVRFVRRLLVASYLVEAGLLLIIAPWTLSWQHNYFGLLLPALGSLMENQFFRGAVSGVGLITTFSGIRDLSAAVAARHAQRAERAARPDPLP
jgi:hypothetical protein